LSITDGLELLIIADFEVGEQVVCGEFEVYPKPLVTEYPLFLSKNGIRELRVKGCESVGRV